MSGLGFLASMALSSQTGNAAHTGPRGAAVPFTTYEAEAPANRTTGKVVKMTGIPTRTTAAPELEASGRGYVEMMKAGDYLDFPNVRAANTIVIRHCIPDAPTGGGLSATLSLSVNNAFRQSLPLSSRHNWLYGEAGQNGQSNDPSAGAPHVFWDETRFFIKGGVKQGDTIRLQKDAADTAAFYRVDLIDLESAPDPLPPPAAGTYLSVTDHGANGSDSADDTAAIQACIAAAKPHKKKGGMRCPPAPITRARSSTWRERQQALACGGTMVDRHSNSAVSAAAWVSAAADKRRFLTCVTRRTSTLAGASSGAGRSRPPSAIARTGGWRTSGSPTHVGFWMSGAGRCMRGCRVVHLRGRHQPQPRLQQ